jgi:hypothetical protein
LEWGRIDRSGSYYIPADKLPKLLRRLSAPLGVKNLPKAMIKKALILTLFTCNVRIEDGKVHFSSVLKALAARLDGIEPPPEPPRRKRRGSVGSVMSEDEESLFSNPFGEDDQVKHLYAAIHVQSAWRRKEAVRRVQLAKIRARKQKGSAGRGGAGAGGEDGAPTLKVHFHDVRQEHDVHGQRLSEFHILDVNRVELIEISVFIITR